MSRALAIRLVGAGVATGGLALMGVGTIGAPVFSDGVALQSAGGNNNKGDVWVDNVGQLPGPGHEMDPHLTCININIWGDKMADSSGTYTIIGWPPSGSGHNDLAYSHSWTYNRTTGGIQLLDTVNVHTLVSNAQANGDAPVNIQGLHFKLDFSQDPQKHKTFWVNCAPATTTTSSTSSSSSSSSSTASSSTASSSTSSSSSATSTAPGSTTSATPRTTVTSSGVGAGVLGAATTTPSTGADMEFGFGLGLMIAGGAVALGSGKLFRGRKH